MVCIRAVLYVTEHLVILHKIVFMNHLSGFAVTFDSMSQNISF